MKSRNRVLACSGSMRLPRCCHQRTRMSCQRSIVARRSSGCVTSRSSSRPSSRRRMCRRRSLRRLRGSAGEVLARRWPAARFRGTGWAVACAGAARPTAARVRSQSPFARHPGAARATRRCASSTARIASVPDGLACGRLGQHVPVVAGRATQLASGPGTGRGAPAPAGPGRPAGRRRGPSRRTVSRLRAQCAHHARAHSADENGVASSSSANSCSHSGSSASIARGGPPSACWTAARGPRRSARAPPQAQHPHDSGCQRRDAQQHAREAGRRRPTPLPCWAAGARSNSRAGAPRTAATKSASSQR